MKLPRWTTYPAIALILLMVVVAVPQAKRGRGAARSSRIAVNTSGASTGTTQLTPQEGAIAPTAGANLRVVDFLPDNHVTDGTVDYRAELQQAISAAAGKRLELPGYPLFVGRAPGQKYGVRLSSGLHMVGSPHSSLVTSETGLQIIRGENVQDVTLEGFSLKGPGGDGQAMGHGLLQITGGANIRVSRLTIRDADADGMAFSQVKACQVQDCLVERASKSAIYLASCADGIVESNRVDGFGGHVLSSGKTVGVGIQLSSNNGVLCRGNSIRNGTGIGILCNAFTGGAKPADSIISNNYVSEVRNPSNLGVSGGIRLANGNPDKQTRTVVSSNRVDRCGANGLYIENHGESSVIGNLVTLSDRAGIMVSTISGLQLTENLVRLSGQSGTGSVAAIHLINSASGVVSRGNWTGESEGYAPNLNHSSGSQNSLEPRLRHGTIAPQDGEWNVGDRVYNTQPNRGEAIGWVCIGSGSPGVWSAFGRVE